jgi:hypothetical protein
MPNSICEQKGSKSRTNKWLPLSGRTISVDYPRLMMNESSKCRLMQAEKTLETAHKQMTDGIDAFNTALIAFTKVHDEAVAPGTKSERGGETNLA